MTKTPNMFQSNPAISGEPLLNTYYEVLWLHSIYNFNNHHTPTQNHIIIQRSWLVTSWWTQSMAAAYRNKWCQNSYTDFPHLLHFHCTI